MKKLCLTMLILIQVSGICINAQISPKDKGLEAITLDVIKGQLEFLASDWTEGRATGEKGYFLAADYVASMFKVFGAAPAGDVVMGGGPRMQRNQSMLQAPRPKSYFQNFTLLENQPGAVSLLTIQKNGNEYTFEENVDFKASEKTVSGKVQAPLVFVGYGFVDKTNGYDDFAGVDIKGKIIIRLSGFPGSGDVNSPVYKKIAGDSPRAAYEISRKKDEILASMGVSGVIDITQNTDIAKRWGVYKFDYNLAPAEGNTRTNWKEMSLDRKEISSAPVTLYPTGRVANLLLKDSGIDLAKYEKDASSGIVKFKPVPITGMTATITTNVDTKRIRVRNVVAMIEGENTNEFVAVGAHLDHMGMDNGNIWNGADDNASGTVAVMTIAKAFAASGIKPKRTIVFCAWTGEEKGLLGSEYFTLYPVAGKITDYKFYMNFDMIARDNATDTAKNMAGITYTKAFPKLEDITKVNKDQYKLNLNLNIKSAEAPTGGSDYTAFSDNKIPVIAWMAAMHPDYHQPSDQVIPVNWNKMLDIIKLGYLQMWEAANGEIK